MNISPETFPVILGHIAEASTTVDMTAQAVNIENANGLFIIVAEYTAGGDTDLVLTVNEGASAAVVNAATYPLTTGAEFPIWVCLDPATSDAMVRQTDAVTYTIDATPTTNVVVCFYVPASVLTAGRPWVGLGTSGGNASNLVSVIYLLDGARYQQETPLTAIA